MNSAIQLSPPRLNLVTQDRIRARLDSAPPRAQRQKFSRSIRIQPAGGERMYKGAQVDRLTQDWPITITSANAEILVSAIALRSRNRQLERDDDYMRQMLTLLENNVIGDRGIRPRLKLKNAQGDYDHKLILEVRRGWRRYLKKRNCTVTRNQTGVELQRMAVRALGRDGALLLRKHRGFSNDFAFALEAIEIDRLDHWYSRPAVGNENEIQFGIEYDRFKAPVAYWILTRHPGDVFAWRSGPKYRERVPAQDIIPLWTTERAGQIVGMPLWPSIGARLNHLHKYEEAELVASRIAAAKGGWFKKKDEHGEYVGPEDDQGNKLNNVEPGAWEELPMNWEPVANDPQHPMDAYPYFIKGQLRGAAAGANLPYNAVANDLEGVNYSSIRAGLLEARDSFRYLQGLVAEKLMDDWFEDWLPYAVISGQIKLSMDRIPEVLEVLSWQGRRWPWVDPLNDIRAQAMAVDCGFTSRRRVVEESEAGDLEEVFEEQEQDNQLAKKHQLQFGIYAPKGDAKPAEPVVKEGG